MKDQTYKKMRSLDKAIYGNDCKVKQLCYKLPVAAGL